MRCLRFFVPPMLHYLLLALQKPFQKLLQSEKKNQRKLSRLSCLFMQLALAIRLLSIYFYKRSAMRCRKRI